MNEIAYTMIDSPVDTLLLASTDEGLLRVAYAREDHDAVLDLRLCTGFRRTVLDGSDSNRRRR